MTTQEDGPTDNDVTDNNAIGNGAVESRDVVIVGGGPNGLLLACELALAGVRPVVLERLPRRATEPKANGMVGQVVQALHYRGLYERLGGTGTPVPMPLFQFGALVLDMSKLDNNSLYALRVPQRRMEEILEQRARELGVEIRRGHEVSTVAQDSEGVLLDVRGHDGEYRLRARYAVGADGGHSVIRKRSGIGFLGVTDEGFVARTRTVVIPPPVASAASGELDLPGFGRLRPMTFTRTENGMFAYGMFRPGVYTVSVYEWGRTGESDEPADSLALLRDAVRRVLGADMPMSEPADGVPAVRRTIRTINSRQADRYRRGRIFLVGDAAHVHSAIGGPGLNLGMQDAFNLAWKLAAEINGWAPHDLLDTYHRERHPVGARVVMHSRAQMALLSPGPNITALRELFGELLLDEGNVRHISDLMSGSDTRYDMRPTGPAHPLTGGWMPDLSLRDNTGSTSVAHLMRAARPVLLDLANRTELVEAAAHWSDRVDIVTATLDRPATADGVSDVDAVLIRPDGYVAWAAGGDTRDAIDGLQHALHTWFGRPVSRAG